MKIPVPILKAKDVDLVRDWPTISAEMNQFNGKHLLVVDKKVVKATIVCKPKLDKLLLSNSDQHHEANGIHCYKLKPDAAKPIFKAYMQLDDIKNILGDV